MRLSIFVLLCFSMLFSCNNKTAENETSLPFDGFTINGAILNQNNKAIYLAKVEDNATQPVDTTLVKNNHFTFKGKVASPSYYVITTEDDRQIKLLVDNTTIDVLITKSKDQVEIVSKAPFLNDYYTFYATQSHIDKEMYAAFSKYNHNVKGSINSSAKQKLNKTLDSLTEIKITHTQSYIKKHLNDITGLTVLDNFKESLPYTTVKEQYKALENNSIATKNNNTINDYITTIEETLAEAEAAKKQKVVAATKTSEYRPKAYSFSGATPTGSQLSLGNVSNGNVVLIDFWASWCQPCRAQSPHIVRMYQKYKNQGFKVLSVSEDKDTDAWQRAIAQDNFTWNTHIIDKNKNIAFRYGISAIPHTILIDKNGNIAAEKLSGNSLEQKIIQLLAE